MSNAAIIRENYEALLLSYAAGALNQAQNFAVTVHLALSPEAREFVRRCETIGAALMECECEPVAMHEHALHNVLAQIENKRREEQRRRAAVMLPPEVRIPLDLLDRISCRPCQPQWRNASYSGLQVCELPMDCRASAVHFIKSRPAAMVPHHVQRDVEITLVLDGAFVDETGMYRRGDMMVMDSETEHETQACRDKGLVAMVVTDSEVKFPAGLAALIQSFLR